MKLKCSHSLQPYQYSLVYKEKRMAQERPLDLNEFFQSRNEIANAHGGKLELQAMGRVREHMVEEASKNVVNYNKAEGKKEK